MGDSARVPPRTTLETRESWTAYVSQAAPTGSQRLRALGWGEGHSKAFAILQEAAGADLIPALVTEAGDGGCTAETGTGTIRATYGSNLLLSMARDPLRRPLIDDWIAVRSWPDGRQTAEAILSRRITLFKVEPPRPARPETLSDAPCPAPLEQPRPARSQSTQPPRRRGRRESGPDF
jgi:ribosome biogenesis GTPase